MNQVEFKAPDSPLTDSQEEHWNNEINCTKCGAVQTRIWRLSPEGDKNTCNECGVRRKRSQEGAALETEKTIRKRKKKKSELEILMCEDSDVFVNGKRSRVKQQLSDDLQNVRDSPSTKDDEKLSTSCPQNSILSSQLMELDDSATISKLPNDSPFPFSGKVEGRVSKGGPIQISSLRRSVGETNPSESPFTSNFSSSVPLSTFAPAPVSVAPPGDSKDADRSADIDVNLLRQILTRLENLRKEHRKTTAQVQIMVSELESNPELFSNSNDVGTPSELRNGTSSTHGTGSSPFPMSSSVPFQRSSPLARSHNRPGSDH